AMQEGVLEALDAHGALRTHTLRGFDTGSVGREELSGTDPAAPRVEHPRVLLRGFFHRHLQLYELYGGLVPPVRICIESARLHSNLRPHDVRRSSEAERCSSSRSFSELSGNCGRLRTVEQLTVCRSY